MPLGQEPPAFSFSFLHWEGHSPKLCFYEPRQKYALEQSIRATVSSAFVRCICVSPSAEASQTSARYSGSTLLCLNRLFPFNHCL